MADKTVGIVFDVQDKGVEKLYSRLSAAERQYSDQVIKDTGQIVKSNEDLLRAFDRRIKLMEQEARLSRLSGVSAAKERLESDPRFQTGGTKDRQDALKDYKDEVLAIRDSSKSQREQLEVLRNIRQSIGQQVVIQQKQEKDQAKALQQEQKKKSEVESRDNVSAGRELERTTNIVGNIATQRNEIYMAAAVAGLIPLIGSGLSAIMSKLFAAAEKSEQGLMSVYQIGSGGMVGGAQYGYDEASLRMMQGRVSRFVGKNAPKETINSAILQRGLGLGEGDIGIMQRLLREESYTGTKTNSLSVLKDLRGAMFAAGNKDDAKIPEYLAIANQLSQEQLNRLASVDVGINSRMIAMLSTGNLANPEVLKNIIPKLQRGLVKGSNSQMEALQLSVLSQLMPGATYTEMMMAKENPFSNPKYLESLMSQFLANPNVSLDEQRLMTQALLGGTISEADVFLKGWKGRTITSENVERELSILRDKGESIESRASRVGGIMKTETSQWETKFQQWGEKTVQGISTLVSKIDSLLNFFPNFFGSLTENQTLVGRIVNQQAKESVAVKIIMGNPATALLYKKAIENSIHSKQSDDLELSNIKAENKLKELTDQLKSLQRKPLEQQAQEAESGLY